MVCNYEIVVFCSLLVVYCLSVWKFCEEFFLKVWILLRFGFLYVVDVLYFFVELDGYVNYVWVFEEVFRENVFLLSFCGFVWFLWFFCIGVGNYYLVMKIFVSRLWFGLELIWWIMSWGCVLFGCGRWSFIDWFLWM